MRTSWGDLGSHNHELALLDSASESLQLAAALLEIDPDPRSRALIQLSWANIYLQQGKFDKALRQLGELTNYEENDIGAEAYRLEGLIKQAQQDSRSETSFLKSLERCHEEMISPYHEGRICLDLARYYHGTSKLPEMEKYLSLATKCFTGVGAAYYLDQIVKFRQSL